MNTTGTQCLDQARHQARHRHLRSALLGYWKLTMIWAEFGQTRGWACAHSQPQTYPGIPALSRQHPLPHTSLLQMHLGYFVCFVKQEEPHWPLDRLCSFVRFTLRSHWSTFKDREEFLVFKNFLMFSHARIGRHLCSYGRGGQAGLILGKNCSFHFLPTLTWLILILNLVGTPR